MSKKIIVTITLIIIVLLIAGFWALNRNQLRGDSPSNDNLTVAATIFPLSDITQAIGGEKVNVVMIIPPGVTEHSSNVTPQLIQQLQPAKTIFQIGHGLDDRLTERITRTLPNVPIVTVDRGITLREFGTDEHTDHEDEQADEHSDSGIDPHYWLSVPNASLMAGTIAAKLQELDPANAQVYAQNLAVYQAELGTLEQELQNTTRGMRRKEFMAMHDAWSYLAAQYGLRLVAKYEPVEGQDPSVGDLRELQEVISQYGISTFFAEPQKASSSVTQLMQREFNLKIAILDPLGGSEQTGSYIDLMKFNLSALAQGQ